MSVSPVPDALNGIFVGDSEMARRMRDHDWASTPLGPPETWPSAVRVAVRLLLTSGFQMLLACGPEGVILYNDPYRSTLGPRHPRALGQPIRDVWPEIRAEVEARFRKVYAEGVGTWDEDFCLILTRHGYPEETYHTFSYSPVIGDSGKVEGVLCTVREETDRILSERRMETVRALASGLALASNRSAVLAAVEAALRTNPHALPFSLVYLFDLDGSARLAASTGLSSGHPLAPVRLTAGCAAPWDMERLRRTAGIELIDIGSLAGRPAGAWQSPPDKAALVPLLRPDGEPPVGVLIVGLNPFRPADDDYLGFLKLLADHIMAGLASAEAYEAECRRASTLAEAARLRQDAADTLRQANMRLTFEMALRTKERDQLRLLFERTPSFMCLLRASDFVYELANRAYEELVACRNLIGRSVPEALPHVVFGVRLKRMMKLMRRGEAYVGRDVPIEVTTADGQPPETRFVNVIFQPVLDPSDALTHVFIEGHDVTDRKRAQEALQGLNETLEQRVSQRTAELAETLEQLKRETEERAAAEAALRHAQKLEALGRLTGGIAHDFNNLLQVISGNLQLLAGSVPGNERAKQRINSALGGVARGSRLAQQLLAFGRRQPLEPKVTHIGRLVLNMDDMLRRTLGEAIEITMAIADDLGNALVDPGQFENALLNLAINARDAMAGHGRLVIEARNALLDEEGPGQPQEAAQPGPYVMVAVTDSGSGIAPHLLEQVFEPFFTTKAEGHGTGLGLPMVHGFVKQSGGHVKIDSEVGAGTTVRIYLPRVAQGEDALIDTTPQPVRGGTETILVVEDDEEVCETSASLLSELGYNVLRARDAASALRIIESGLPVDLLFTDVIMPGPLRSTELARKARERLPHIAVLFTSGYTQDAVVHGGRLDPGVELLSKPYTREALARKIRHVLANTAQPRAERKPPPPANTKNRPALTILLVEDEEMIRLWTAEMLSELGHTVVEASCARTALQAFEQADIDLLISDIGLPMVSGIELAHTARQRCPELPVIFTSGGDAVPASAGLGPCITLLKPFSAGELADALTTVAAPATAG